MKRILFILGLGLLSGSSLAAQTVVASNLSNAQNGGTITRNANAFLAASFTTGSNVNGYTLDSVTLLFSSVSGTINDFAVQIRNNDTVSYSGGVPGTVVATLSGATAPPSNSTGTWNGANLSLAADTKYWVSWGFTSGNGYANIPMTTDASSTGTWNLGDYYGTSSNGGTTWYSSQPNVYIPLLSLSASAVPEPSTWAAVFGLCALGAAVWRRRKATT